LHRQARATFGKSLRRHQR